MSAQILEAIEIAVPGITDSLRYKPPSWIEPLKRATNVWLGGINITHVEVTPEWNENSEISRLIVNTFTDQAVFAQASIIVDRDNGLGTFGGWKIVRIGTITSLRWNESSFGGRNVPQVIATFEHLTDPVLIPGEIERSLDIETLTGIFRSLRDAWIDAGISEEEPARA